VGKLARGQLNKWSLDSWAGIIVSSLFSLFISKVLIKKEENKTKRQEYATLIAGKAHHFIIQKIFCCHLKTALDTFSVIK
jgi:hypothetical protein